MLVALVALARSFAIRSCHPSASRFFHGRPALQRLLADVNARRVNVIVVYKVDRLTRSLADFAKLVEMFDAHGVSIVQHQPATSAYSRTAYFVTTTAVMTSNWDLR